MKVNMMMHVRTNVDEMLMAMQVAERSRIIRKPLLSASLAWQRARRR